MFLYERTDWKWLECTIFRYLPRVYYIQCIYSLLISMPLNQGT
jgi:hypothetical protein